MIRTIWQCAKNKKIDWQDKKNIELFCLNYFFMNSYQFKLYKFKNIIYKNVHQVRSYSTKT